MSRHPPPLMPPIRIGALISGGGTTLLNLIDHIDQGRLNAQIVAVVSSRPDAPGVQRLRRKGFDVRVADRKDFATESVLHDQITRWLCSACVELVCLCGYLREFRIDPAFRGRTINIHPALLPKFGGKGMYGLRVHQSVLDAGETESGCTVHFVDDQYDHGPVILQRRVPVLPGDTPHSLAARVFEQECAAYPQAIRMIAEGTVREVNGRTVFSTTA